MRLAYISAQNPINVVESKRFREPLRALEKDDREEDGLHPTWVDAERHKLAVLWRFWRAWDSGLRFEVSNGDFVLSFGDEHGPADEYDKDADDNGHLRHRKRRRREHREHAPPDLRRISRQNVEADEHACAWPETVLLNDVRDPNADDGPEDEENGEVGDELVPVQARQIGVRGHKVRREHPRVEDALHDCDNEGELAREIVNLFARLSGAHFGPHAQRCVDGDDAPDHD
mmetsp:Transcript_2889/g.10515  ORF Transcript_2889/g.10515 Transcript_2889/m.10515 type:complete len:230 (-) Transcript_2889:582-1271(-)